MSEENNLNNKSNKGFERFEEFMYNNSFDIEVEPMDDASHSGSTEESKDESAQKDSLRNDFKDSENEIDASQKEKKPRRRWRWLLAVIIIVGGIIAIAVSVHATTSAQRIRNVWEAQLDGSSWGRSITNGIDISNYKNLDRKKQLEIDYKILLKLAGKVDYSNQGYSAYTSEEYIEAVESYLHFSKSGLSSRQYEIIAEFDKINQNSRQYHLDRIDYDIIHGMTQRMAIDFLSTVDSDHGMDGFFIEIADYLYRDKMIEGCLNVIKDYKRGEGSLYEYSELAEEYLDHAGYIYVSSLMDEEIEAEAAAEQSDVTSEETNETTDAATSETSSDSNSVSGSGSGSSSGSGSGSYTGGSSGRWKPNSGGGLGGSGKIYGGSSSNSSSSSSSSSSKDLNGWADYDEGYDDVMYNDEYDEERYQTDSEYASGVDDARDEYEEVYGEEFD